jgi:hypothetical protein
MQHRMRKRKESPSQRRMVMPEPGLRARGQRWAISFALPASSPCPDIATSSSFFEQAFRQHSAVEDVTRVYDRLYPLPPRACRLTGVFLVDAYDMSAADVRHACDPYGAFDVAVKMNSHGSVTGAAERAAASMGAQPSILGT